MEDGLDLHQVGLGTPNVVFTKVGLKKLNCSRSQWHQIVDKAVREELGVVEGCRDG